MFLLFTLVKADYVSTLGFARTPGVIVTVAGSRGSTTTASNVGSSGDGGVATYAQGATSSGIFASVEGVFMDSVNGYLYVSSNVTGVVRRVSMSTNGLLETIAGTPNSMSSTGDNGPATSAGLNSPNQVVVDYLSNTLLIADTNNYAIRSVDLGTGIISTLVGQVGIQYVAGGTENGVGVPLVGPVALDFDRDGNIFIAETNSYQSSTSCQGNSGHCATVTTSTSLIRKFDRTSSLLWTYAGSMTSSGSTFVGNNVAGTNAHFLNIQSIATSSDDTLWVVDQTQQVLLKILPTSPHTVTIFGGGGTSTSLSSMDGTSVLLSVPISVAVDSQSNVYVSCYGTGSGGLIRVFYPSGKTQAYAGSMVSLLNGNGYSGNGGQALVAQLASPKALSFDADDNLFFADRYNPTGAFATLPQSIRVIFSGKVHFPRRGSYGYMTQLAGTGTMGSSGDGGPASLAKFNQLSSVAVDSSGNIYTRYDTPSHTSLSIILSCTLSHIFLIHSVTYFPTYPLMLLSCSESYGHVRMINSTTGYINRVAGNGTGTENGIAVNAPLWRAPGITIDKQDNIYIADYNHCIRKLVTTTGLISTIIGKRFTSGTIDGVVGNQLPPLSIKLNPPYPLHAHYQ